MLIATKKYNSINKQAEAMHRHLMQSLNFTKAKKLKAVYDDVHNMDSGYTMSFMFGREPRFSVSDLQSDISKWVSLDPGYAKKCVDSSDSVRKLLKSHKISDVPEDEWYDNSDEGADELVSDTKSALDLGLDWYIVRMPYDDLICYRATAPEPNMVSDDIYQSYQQAKYNSSKDNPLNSARYLYKTLGLVTKGGIFRGSNLKDLKAVQSLLFNYHGKQVTQADSSVHQAIFHLEKFFKRHHLHFKDYPVKDRYLVKNRQLFSQSTKQLRQAFVSTKKDARHRTVIAMNHLDMAVQKPVSAYWCVKGDDLVKPNALMAVRTLLKAFQLDK